MQDLSEASGFQFPSNQFSRKDARHTFLAGLLLVSDSLMCFLSLQFVFKVICFYPAGLIFP